MQGNHLRDHFTRKAEGLIEGFPFLGALLRSSFKDKGWHWGGGILKFPLNQKKPWKIGWIAGCQSFGSSVDGKNMEKTHG